MGSGLILGPINPITVEALHALAAIALILLKTPRNEWEFVLSQAKSKAEEIIKCPVLFKQFKQK